MDKPDQARLDHQALRAAKADVDRQLAELRDEYTALRIEHSRMMAELRLELNAAIASLDRIRESTKR